MSSDRPKTAQLIPKKNKAASNLYDLLGGRDGVIDLLEGSQSEKLQQLQTLLISEDTAGTRSDGAPKMTFGKMLSVAGVTEKDVYQLFLDRRRAETQVVLADAEPRLAGELVERASKRRVLCRQCAGTKQFYVDGEDGLESRTCGQCDSQGIETIEGEFEALELVFDLSKLKQAQGGFTVNNNVDNRQVNFQLGGQGTAPSPVSMIRALETVKDVGPKLLNEAPQSTDIPATATVVEAETV